MANFSMKLASTVSAAAIVASSMSASLVSAASEFLPYAEALASKKVINQNTETGYRLNDQITRAELAKVAANLGGYTAVECTGKVFTDVNATLGDLCTAIETLAAAKVISTATPNFRPTANVTRAEMTKMILGALAVKPVAMGTHKFADVSSALGDLEGFINAAVDKGIVNKAMNFRPNATGSRGEVFKIAANAAGLEIKTDDKKTEAAKAGTATVSLVGSATAQYVPMNASSVNVGKIKVTATGGDVKLDSIVVARSGLGNPGDIEASNGIRFAHNGKIVSASSNYYNQFEQQGNVMFSPAITLKNNESIELDTLVSLSGASNSQHQFSIVKVNKDLLTTPVTLGLINTTSYAATTVSTELKAGSSVRAGTKEQRIVDVTLTPADRAVKVTGFNVTRSNTANTKRLNYDLTRLLTNVKVYENGKILENAKTEITADKIFVSGLNLDIPYGRKTLQLRGDILLDGSSDEVGFVVEDSSDVTGTEVATNQVFRVAPYKTPVYVTITGVKNTFESNVTANQFVSTASSDYVTLADAKITSEAPVKITKLNVKNHSETTNTLTSGNIDGNLIVRVNGTRVADIDPKDIFKKDGEKTLENLGYVVDTNYPLNIAVEGRLKGLSNGNKIKLTLTLPKDGVTDIANRPATLSNMSVDSHLTTARAATLELMTSERKELRVDPKISKTYEVPFSLRAKTDNTSSKEIVLIANEDLKLLLDNISTSNVKLKRNGSTQSLSKVEYVDGTKTLTLTLDAAIDFYKDEENKFVLELITKNNIDNAFNNKTLNFTYNGSTIPTNIVVGSKRLDVDATLVTTNNATNDIATIKLRNTSDEQIEVSTIVVAADGKDSNSRFKVENLNLLTESNLTLANAARAVDTGLFTFDLSSKKITIAPNSEATVKVSTNVRFGDEKFAVSIRSMTYGGAEDKTLHAAK